MLFVWFLVLFCFVLFFHVSVSSGYIPSGIEAKKRQFLFLLLNGNKICIIRNCLHCMRWQSHVKIALLYCLLFLGNPLWHCFMINWHFSSISLIGKVKSSGCPECNICTQLAKLLSALIWKFTAPGAFQWNMQIYNMKQWKGECLNLNVNID